MNPSNDNDEPDFSGMISAEVETLYIKESGEVTVYPAGMFTGRIIGRDRVEQETLIEALIERGRA